MHKPILKPAIVKRRRVAPSLYKSESTGVYFAHVRSGGKLYRESLRTDDRSIANRRLRELRRRVSRVDPGLSKTTLAAMADLYLDTIEHRSHSTKKGRRAIIKRLKATFYGADCLPLSDIKPSQIESWLAKQAGRLSASHFNTYITALRDIFTLAVRDRYIADSPIAEFKYRKREQPIRLTPSWEDFQAIIADIRKQPFNADAKDSADFVEFIGLAGIGQAEAAGLCRKHVHFDFGQLQLFRYKTRQAFTIPMFPQVRPLLERLCKGLKANDRVFPISSARKALAGACKRLGLPHYTHRSFRRMFITRAIEKGVDVKVIAEWQGHRDQGVLILKTYSHVRAEHSQRMASLMTTEQPANVVAYRQEGASFNQ
jgi:integrase